MTALNQEQQQRQKELARRKRERIIIAFTLLAVVLVTYLETRVVVLSDALPMGSSILVFALININALLLLTLIFLVARNLVKLIMERRSGVLGARLRTKLVAAFVILSLAPTALVFFAAFQFMGTSMDYWFRARVERSLFDALELNRGHRQQTLGWAAHFAGLLAKDLSGAGFNLASPSKELSAFVEQRRQLYDLAAVRVFTPGLKEVAYATQSGTHLSHLRSFPLDSVSRAVGEKRNQSVVKSAPTGDFAAVAVPVFARGKAPRPRATAAVVVFKLLPKEAMARSAAIRKGLTDYRELMHLKKPIKTNQYISLSIVALLVLFGAIWFAFYMAKSLTVPLMELADGTQRIAEGDYNVYIDQEGPDEIGTLINAFNRMSADLTTSKARLDEAQEEMRRTNLELERRRRYMEIVLRNVAAGVVAVDARGAITTFNPSAERFLKVQSTTVLGKPWREMLTKDNVKLVEEMISGVPTGSTRATDRQVRVNLGGESLSLMVHLSYLKDETGRQMGMVVVFEDMTELEKAQRMAAWREVARRIAHEVKNPLTPIKLSAQRLVRRYREKLADDPQVFDECTQAIIGQVEELRRLVNEFSTFARLPASRLAPADLDSIVDQVMTMYQGAHLEVSFTLEREDAIPVFELDREQISRVLINLLDNAVSAAGDTPPPHEVAVSLSFDDILRIVRLEVADNGPGVSPEDKVHMFEPYFSTKKGGTGLGLAIVSTIVADHGGYARVQDNENGGTRIIIELPVRGAKPFRRETA